MASPRRAGSSVSSVDAWRERVAEWLEAGVQGKVIHAALCRQHGYRGSYSSDYRKMVAIRGERPAQTTVRLDFEPGDAAHLDFGAGPILIDPDGRSRRTWAFVMTLAHSRHQYVESVWNQTVATWPGCPRGATVSVPALKGREVMPSGWFIGNVSICRRLDPTPSATSLK